MAPHHIHSIQCFQPHYSSPRVLLLTSLSTHNRVDGKKWSQWMLALAQSHLQNLFSMRAALKANLLHAVRKTIWSHDTNTKNLKFRKYLFENCMNRKIRNFIAMKITCYTVLLKTFSYVDKFLISVYSNSWQHRLDVRHVSIN